MPVEALDNSVQDEERLNQPTGTAPEDKIPQDIEEMPSVALSKEDKKDTYSETSQNWVTFSLIAIGIAFGTIGGYTAWFLVALGVVLSLFLIIKRSLSRKPKRISALSVTALLCWTYVLTSYWLLMIIIHISSGGLDIIVGWFVSVVYAGITALILTCIELFRTSER